MILFSDDSVFGKESLAQEIVETFGQAKYYGIHRTINVGDYTSAHSIYNAVITLHPERIGHGHRILDNNDLYNYVVNENVHFELCPSSSVITGAVNSKSSEKHPIHRFIEDNVNFSINAGDPTLTQKWNLDEAKYCLRELGLKQTQLNKVNINAAKAAFIIPEERTLLLSHLKSRTRNRIIKI
ncbi:unnamed protein product [Heterobilharzia americana]|nr:unnamed protein product [Heterobilharzia americana]